jgi:hypothetical protein
MSARRRWLKRVFVWGVSLGALAFVVHTVPIRDRCEDPAAIAAGAERVPVSRDQGACVLHRAQGDLHLGPEV